METIGSLDAKNHWSTLLNRVAHGETIVITRHGKPVAQLVPTTDDVPQMTLEEAVAAMIEFRSGRSLGGLSIRELIDEGRRY